MADKDTIISALQTQANIIKNERKQQANTAMRIGSMFSAIVEVLEQIIYIDNLFSLVKDQNGNYYIYTPYPLASEKSISTKGIGSSSGGGGSFDRLDTWPDAWDDKYGTYVLSAYLGYDLNTRVATIENNIGSKVTTLGDLANVSSTVNEESTKDTMMFKDAGRNEWRAISVKEVSEITDKTFVYTQGTAKNTWTIVHNLNKYPTVSVIDSAKTVVIGEVRYDSLNQVTLLFASAFSGMATLN